MYAEVSNKSANINFSQFYNGFFRNVLLKLFKSSTCQAIWRRIQLTDIRPIHSNFIVFQLLDLVKFLVWLELMELENPQHSRFLQESRSQIWAVSRSETIYKVICWCWIVLMHLMFVAGTGCLAAEKINVVFE